MVKSYREAVIIEVSPRSGHSLTQNLITRVEGPKKLSAGTSRKNSRRAALRLVCIYKSKQNIQKFQNNRRKLLSTVLLG